MTAAVAHLDQRAVPPPAPRLWRLPAGSEPPYDDDVAPGAATVPPHDGTTPRNLGAGLSTAPPIPASATPAAAPRSRVRGHRPRRTGGQAAGPVRVVDGTDSRFLPTPRSAAAVVTRAILEVLSGSRPAAHLAGWTTPSVQADIERVTSRVNVRRRYTLRSVRVAEPQTGTAEVTAVIGREDRVAALALRLESTDGRWRVTRLVVG